eukprot:4463004-Pyramimonas_sp.AAC.1
MQRGRSKQAAYAPAPKGAVSLDTTVHRKPVRTKRLEEATDGPGRHGAPRGGTAATWPPPNLAGPRREPRKIFQILGKPTQIYHIVS